MKYPNRVIRKGESDKCIVKAIQKQLNIFHCGPLLEDGDFGNLTFSAVKQFQARNTDINGVPLVVEGKIGSITWQVLFPQKANTSVTETANSLLKEVLSNANSQIGVREVPPNSNRGPQVSKYLESVGLNANADDYPWCMAFVYWCFKQASQNLNVSNPLVKTGGVLKQWNETKYRKIKKADAVNRPTLINPGFVFIRNYGNGFGHTGIVTIVDGGFIDTIEGNSNDNGTREGIGVFALRRKINTIENGFIDFSKKA